MALAAALAQCAPALNYTDPRAPLYSGGRGIVGERGAGLRIVTFNIAYARRVDEALGCLARPPLADADVVLLQEMHVGAVERMAAALGMHYVYAPSSVRPGQNDMGTAVLSPWPVDAAEKLILPHTTRVIGRGRAATLATVHVNGRPIRVYSLHLGSPLGLGGDQRGDQAEAVLAHARAWDGPVIAGGDLNSHSVGDRFEAAGFRWLTKAIGNTVGPFSFDHVYVRGLEGAADVGVARDCREASDHRPVWTVLR